jgi:uncharacterized protein YciI
VAKFALLLTYGDRAKRDETRPAHREYLQHLLAEGKLYGSGPFTDDSGALIIYEASSQAEAESLWANDPYCRAHGVAADAVIREWGRIIGV